MLEVLRAARELISDPARWTAGVFARDKDGQECKTRSLEAVCWCSWGALVKLAPTPSVTSNALTALNNASYGLGYNSAPVANDNGGHRVVLKMFDIAIEKEQNAS